MENMNEKKFDEAEFYSVSDCCEELIHSSPEEVISEEGRLGTPMRIYAWDRIAMDENYIPGVSDKLAECLAEDYDDEYGGGLDPILSDGDEGELAAKFKSILVEFLEDHPPWRCDIVADREFSAEDVTRILIEHGEFER